jgi:hypothetical protein
MRQLFRLGVALTVVAGVSLGSPAMAAQPNREPSQPSGFGELPAGVACAFPVSIDLVSGDEGQNFTFFDQDGNVVRQVGTARTSVWRITNLDTNVSYTVNLPGGTLTSTPASDGSTTVVVAGGAIGFNAPTDTPPGPFSFTNVGRVVLVIAPDGSGTIVSMSGHTFDLCAAVAS